jgi:hypothetical protein
MYDKSKDQNLPEQPKMQAFTKDLQIIQKFIQFFL